MSTKTPISPKLGHDVFWAYIHSQDGAIHVKKWFPPPPGKMCDADYAREEQKNGNDFITAIVGPYAAPIHKGWLAAATLFARDGYNFKGREQLKVPGPDLQRFEDLDLDD